MIIMSATTNCDTLYRLLRNIFIDFIYIDFIYTNNCFKLPVLYTQSSFICPSSIYLKLFNYSEESELMSFLYNNIYLSLFVQAQEVKVEGELISLKWR